MSESVFPLRRAYSYVETKAPWLADQVERIRSTTVEDPVYGGTSQYRRAAMVRLLKDNGLWDDFCRTQWPEAFTSEGDDILNELRRHYPHVLGP